MPPSTACSSLMSLPKSRQERLRRLGTPPAVRPGAAEGQETESSNRVAKLDRLSRDVAFVATLMAKKVDSRDASDPNASPFMLHIKAAVAEEERRLISSA